MLSYWANWNSNLSSYSNTYSLHNRPRANKLKDHLLINNFSLVSDGYTGEVEVYNTYMFHLSDLGFEAFSMKWICYA